MSFDKKLFAELLCKAKGDRSINKYANDIDISPAHISRLLRQLLNTPPSPETINKFASKAQNGVSYDQLMKAAGHLSETVSIYRFRGIKVEESAVSGSVAPVEPGKAEQMERDLLLSFITQSYAPETEWCLHKINNAYSHFYISIENSQYAKLMLRFKSFWPLGAEEVQNAIYSIYGEISTFEFNADTKIIIAVPTENEFNLLVKYPPKALKANLFVMQFNIAAKQVLREERLCDYK